MPRFTVRHYETRQGRDPIRTFLEDLPRLEHLACDEVIGWLESGEIDQHPRNFAYLSDGIWELRVSFNGKQFRFLYVTEAGEAFIVMAFQKKTQQTPLQHLDLAKRRIGELKRRGVVP